MTRLTLPLSLSVFVFLLLLVVHALARPLPSALSLADPAYACPPATSSLYLLRAHAGSHGRRVGREAVPRPPPRGERRRPCSDLLPALSARVQAPAAGSVGWPAAKPGPRAERAGRPPGLGRGSWPRGRRV